MEKSNNEYGRFPVNHYHCGVHMIFRTMLHALLSRFGARLGHWDVARTSFRVLPTDLDILKHMNNGVYLSIADIGRFDLLQRNGVWAIFKKRGWYPVVASETISFRKSLELWQPFVVESRILGFDEKAVYVEQRFTVDGEIYTQAFIRGPFPQAERAESSPSTNCWRPSGPSPTDVTIPEWLHRMGYRRRAAVDPRGGAERLERVTRRRPRQLGPKANTRSRVPVGCAPRPDARSRRAATSSRRLPCRRGRRRPVHVRDRRDAVAERVGDRAAHARARASANVDGSAARSD